MTPLWIVEFGDPQAHSGFIPYTDRKRPVASTAFWDAAESLRESTVCQPPTRMPPTREHPIWSLRRVQVQGQQDHWCFAVQGRGGAFTEAGTCQFAFAPTSADPADMWFTCASMIDADGRLGYQPAHRDPPATDPAGIEAIIEALLHGRRRVGVDGTPAAVAAAIERVLRVLPLPVIAQYAWWSWLLVAPSQPALGNVAGRWPTEMRTKDLHHPRQVDGWLNDTRQQPLPAGNGLSAQHRADVVAWLGRAARHATGPADRPYPNLETMLGLAKAVADDKLPQRVPKVPRLPAEITNPAPVPTEAPADDLTAARVITAEDLRLLHAATDPAAEIRRIAEKLRPITPVDASRLLVDGGSKLSEHEIGMLMAEFMHQNHTAPWDAAIDWLCTLLDKVQGTQLGWEAQMAILDSGIEQLARLYTIRRHVPIQLQRQWVSMKAQDLRNHLGERMMLNSISKELRRPPAHAKPDETGDNPADAVPAAGHAPGPAAPTIQAGTAESDRSPPSDEDGGSYPGRDIGPSVLIPIALAICAVLMGMALTVW